MQTVHLNIASGTAWLEAHWYVLLAALVVVASGSLYLVRRRSFSKAREPDPDRKQNMQRRMEDSATFAVAAGASALSAAGLQRIGRNVMGLADPWSLLPFVALDIAAMVCGSRARRRASQGKDAGVFGTMVWVLAGVSALFSASEAGNLWYGVIRAVWPLLAAWLFDSGTSEIREETKAKQGRKLDRRLDWLRVVHPVEMVRVGVALAADKDLSVEGATHLVRIERAGHRMYRLRQIQNLRKNSRLMVRLFWSWRETRADRRTQAAMARAGATNPDVLRDIFRATQVRVQIPSWAGMRLNSSRDAEQALGSLVGHSLDRPGTDRDQDVPNRPVPAVPGHPTPDRPGTDSGTGQCRPGTSRPVSVLSHSRPGTGVPDRSGTSLAPVPGRPALTAGRPVLAPSGHPGTQDGADAQVHPGRQDDDGPRDHRVGVGQDTVATGHRDGTGTSGTFGPDNRTDEELVAILRTCLQKDGTFTTGGIGKTARFLGVGSGRAERVMDLARKPAPSQGRDATQDGSAPTPPASQDSAPATAEDTEQLSPRGGVPAPAAGGVSLHKVNDQPALTR